MKKTAKITSCGYDLEFPGPETVEEYDQKGGEVGLCLKDALSNTLYRGTLPEWQEEFARVLESTTGVQRGIDKEATEKLKARAKPGAEVRSVPERFKAYNVRARATWAGEDAAKLSQLAELAQQTADKIEVNPAPSPRGGAGVAKGDLLKADVILDLEPDAIEAKVTKMSAVIGDGFELARDENGKPERYGLARMISRYLDELLK
jgi:hypothetical protein